MNWCCHQCQNFLNVKFSEREYNLWRDNQRKNNNLRQNNNLRENNNAFCSFKTAIIITSVIANNLDIKRTIK